MILRSLRPYLPPAAVRRRLPVYYRSFATQAPGAPTLQVFDRHAKLLQRERAASNVEASRQVDYLKDEIASRLCERLFDVNRDFPSVLDLHASSCHIARALTIPRTHPSHPDAPPTPLSARVHHLTCADTSAAALARDESLPFNRELSLTRTLIRDEPHPLPFAPASFDAVLSSLALHWANDLPGALAEAHRVLRPDAPLIAALLGGDTLFELRGALQLAELERRGGVGHRVSPLADVRDVGNVLSRAGFDLLTVDVDDVVVGFPDIFALMRDLQGMGEGNAVIGREGGAIGREVLAAADAVYRALNGEEDGSLPATFRVIYLIAWKKGEGQPKPLERGSGMVSMKDFLEAKDGKGDKGGGKGGDGEK